MTVFATDKNNSRKRSAKNIRAKKERKINS
jgi:hypothetical protein